MGCDKCKSKGGNRDEQLPENYKRTIIITLIASSLIVYGIVSLYYDIITWFG
tara:strand:+ start:4546 stop:4701 length:156 start_codon:yes stop_codon:yes gene_type:complete